MNAPTPAAGSGSALARLLGFLEGDPENLNLLADAAGAALDEGHPTQTERLLDRYAAIAPLPPALSNLRGVAALANRQFDAARAIFESLLDAAPHDAGLRFNLAWCRAMGHDDRGAVALLDEATIAAVPRGAALKVQMLHQLGPLEDALACGMGLAELYPDDQDLMGALAVVAIDAEEIDLARGYAERAGASHEGLSTLGMLALNADDVDGSLALFDQALEAYGDSGRALLGRGLALLMKGEPAAAAQCLDRSGEIFGAHVGTWVAAGWAHFTVGDYAAARADFERALALDDTFGETQGALAVVDLVENKLASAKRRTTVALRLDPTCLSGALARSLLLAGDGQAEKAQAIRHAALNAPIGANGRTIAQTMVALGLAGPKGSDAV